MTGQSIFIVKNKNSQLKLSRLHFQRSNFTTQPSISLTKKKANCVLLAIFPQRLWVNWVYEYYLAGGKILEYESSVKMFLEPKKIFNARYQACQLIYYSVGVHCSFSMWHYPWVHKQSLAEILGDTNLSWSLTLWLWCRILLQTTILLLSCVIYVPEFKAIMLVL